MEYLLKTYGKYGITENLLIGLIRKAKTEYGYSTEQAIALLRYTMGIRFRNLNETFTASEVSLITGKPIHTVIRQMERLIVGKNRK